MVSNSVKLIYFSPTQTTRKVLEAIAGGLRTEAVTHLDLTPPDARTRVFGAFSDELAIIGAPVYGGRIPTEAATRLGRLTGNDTPAVLVVVYGNRAYEDALLELRDLALDLGFKPIAGGAFIGEHSYSTDSTPLAQDRPDKEDLRIAADFGAIIQKRMRDLSAEEELPALKVPGNHPYRDFVPWEDMSPITQERLCGRCETCVAVCPTAAITVNDTVDTDRELCIACCACVKSCPTGARVMDDPRVAEVVAWLSDKCAERKGPEEFI
jgi:ferredoxin